MYKFLMLFLLVSTFLYAKTGSEEVDRLKLSVEAEDGTVTIDGTFDHKTGNKTFKKTFKKKFKAIFKKDFHFRDRKGAGKDIYVGPQEKVDDVVVVGGKAVIAGHVLGDIKAVGGKIVLEQGARVDGDVTVIGGDAVFNDDVVIMGDVTCIGGEITGYNRATVEGSVTRVLSNRVFGFIVPGLVSFFTLGASFAFCLIYMSWIFTMIFLVGIFTHYFLPEPSENIKKILALKPGISFLVGLIAIVSFIPINIILLITIIWIFFIPVCAILFFLISCWGLAMLLTALGGKLPINKKRNEFVNFLSGLAILFIISLIPFVGTFVMFVAGTMGLGAVFVSKFGKIAQ